jgi:DNA-binding PadR family transcriptional regulator
MSDKKYLGELEQLLLMAILRLNNRAYGVEIRQLMLDSINRDVSIGALYTVLSRLEDKGLLSTSVGGSSAERGGRAKKYYRVTAQGQTALHNSIRMIDTLKDGLALYESHPRLLSL